MGEGRHDGKRMLHCVVSAYCYDWVAWILRMVDYKYPEMLE
jgi:hypothetical protein